MPLVALADIGVRVPRLDVFVSYAHVDDPADEGERGWITRFVLNLDRQLNMQLGRNGAAIFMDHQLAAGIVVTPALRQAAGTARTLLLFLSKGYQQSPWCRDELVSFLDGNASGPLAPSVFVVELLATERSTWHQRLQDLKTVQMWTQDPTALAPRLLGYPKPKEDESNPYWLKINDLAFAIVRGLEAGLPEAPATASSASSAPPARAPLSVPVAVTARPTVWIAQPVVELSEYWDLLRAALSREQIQVLPQAAQVYPLGSALAFKDAAEKDMAQCTVLVQLLGGSAGPRFGESTVDLAGLQSQLLNMRSSLDPSLRVLSWRAPGIDLSAVGDPSFKALLLGASSENFEQFRRALLAACGRVPATPQPEPDDVSLGICVAAGNQDADTCKQLLNVIETMGHRAVQPPLQPAPNQGSGEYQSHVDEIIQACDAMILVYGCESAPWLQAQYLRAQRLLAKRRRLWGAVLDAPPPKEQPPQIADRRVMPLDCRNGISIVEVQRFLDALVVEAGYA